MVGFCLLSVELNGLTKMLSPKLQLNMEGPYGSEWPEEEKVKRKEMVLPEAHYVFVHEVANSNADEMTK